MAMKISNKFSLEQKVYLETDTEQHERIVTGIIVHPSNLTYLITCGTEISEHYDFEIREDKQVI